VFKDRDIPKEIPEIRVQAEGNSIWIARLLVEADLVKGTGEARRMLQQNAVSVDGERISDLEYSLPTKGEVLLKVGKRRFCRVFFN